MSIFDTQQLLRNQRRFAANQIEEHAIIKEMRSRLLESLEYYQEKKSSQSSALTVLEISWDHGETAHALQSMLKKSQVISVKPVIEIQHQHSWNPFRKKIRYLQGELNRLPVADASVDVLVSFLSLQWVEDLDAVFAEFRRVLKPEGFMLCMTFGQQTLIELREAFAEADASVAHVHPFPTIADLGDSLLRAGFQDPVLDRDDMREHYPDVQALLYMIKRYSNTSALQSRRRHLTGKKRFSEMRKCYEHQRTHPSIIANWEFISAHAWAPKPGVAIRHGGRDVVTFPGHAIPVRKRNS